MLCVHACRKNCDRRRYEYIMPAWVFNREVGRSRIDEELEAGGVDKVIEGADGVAGKTESRPRARFTGGQRLHVLHVWTALMRCASSSSRTMLQESHQVACCPTLSRVLCHGRGQLSALSQ